MRSFLPATFCVALLLTALPANAQSGTKDAVVAKVGTTEVRRSEVEAMLEAYGDKLSDLPPAERFETALERTIDMHLIARAAREAKLQDDPEVKRLIALAERDVLQEAFINRVVTRETTDKALKERYAKVYYDGKGIRSVKVRHILTYTKGKAEEMIRALNDKADFAKLASENTVDNRTAAAGGELGWLEKEKTTPAFLKAAMALDVGAHTKTPVETEHGWHVIKIDDEKFEKGPTFEQAKAELAQDAVEESISSMLQKMREGVKIERLDGAKPPASGK